IVAAFGALFAAVVALFGTYRNTNRTTESQETIAKLGRENAVILALLGMESERTEGAMRRRHDTALAEATRDHATDEANRQRDFTRTIEDGRIQLEYEKMHEATGASGRESWIAVKKLVHDRQTEEAKLIHLYFDKLLSKNPMERYLALSALS